MVVEEDLFGDGSSNMIYYCSCVCVIHGFILLFSDTLDQIRSEVTDHLPDCFVKR